MGNLRIDLTNVVTISLVAFVAVFLINRALSMAGYSQYRA